MDEVAISSDVTRLVERLRAAYGLDYAGYARASFERRVLLASRRLAEGSVAKLTDRLLAEPRVLNDFIDQISVHLTDVFRDPGAHLAFRREVVPALREKASLRIWIAGCSSGEEVYSLAVLLYEEGLLERTQIFATDVSVHAVERARAGIFCLKRLPGFELNYRAAGGQACFADYCVSAYGQLRIRDSIRKNISFFRHDLVGDHVFMTADVVLCRNVLFYFGRSLRARVLAKLLESLEEVGFLCVGAGEKLVREDHHGALSSIGTSAGIYRHSPSESGESGDFP